MDCFAIRLDRQEHQSFINDISLLTIPIVSDLKTNQAHEISSNSPFFPSWLSQRKDLILEFIEALDNSDLTKIGELAEFDTHCLHSTTMTAPTKQKIIAWAPDTLNIMLKIIKLRESGYNVYYSIDTGPSIVLITPKKEKDSIIKELENQTQEYGIFESTIGGPSELLQEDLNKFLKD